ncbi:hypothetical protein [Arthrobacter sp. YC-RL1]|uniref:hypothetical protein n=1 Tax=Arthrobacter sp. YC-RL1 TaxID=1652545 RepID=UPI000B18F56B|nr:hypothetical protein [Arthrobacter sp. YC-RL1]
MTLAILNTIAACITALATFGLLLGVWGAFRQINQNRLLHDDQQQLEALAGYISSIQYFGDLQATNEEELIRASTEVRRAGALFRLTFRIVEKDVVGALRRFDEVLLKFVLLEFHRRDSRPYAQAHASFARAVDDLVSTAVDELPRLRSPEFTLNDLRETLTAAANKANSENPDSDIESMVLRSMLARKS